jgi:hypothetical protein
LVKLQKVAPVALVASFSTVPDRIGAPAPGEVMVAVGKGWMARLEPSGQDSMKEDARVKTERTPSGVSKADGMAAALLTVRMKV